MTRARTGSSPGSGEFVEVVRVNGTMRGFVGGGLLMPALGLDAASLPFLELDFELDPGPNGECVNVNWWEVGFTCALQ